MPGLFKGVAAVQHNDGKQKIAISQNSNGNKAFQTIVPYPDRFITRRRHQLLRGDWKWNFAAAWQVFPCINLLPVCFYKSAVVGCSRLSKLTPEPQPWCQDIGAGGASIHTEFGAMPFGRRGGKTLVSNQVMPPEAQNSGRATRRATQRAANARSTLDKRLGRSMAIRLTF